MTQSENESLYYEEIDIRRYVRSVIKNIQWIILAAVMCAVAALVISLLQPRTYEAFSLVAITKPRYMLQLDPRLVPAQQLQPPYKAYPEIALSGDVLSTVIGRLETSSQAALSMEAMRGRLSATNATDPSLIRLSVKSANAEEAARIANIWAEAFVEHAEAIYWQGGNAQADFFTAQFSRAEADLQLAETALIDYQSHNEGTILQNRLDSDLQTQSDYLKAQRNVTYLVQDVRNLQAQLAGQPRTYQASLADQMTALFLQVKAFNAQSESPIQIHIGSAESLSSLTTTEQIAFLNDLVTVLEQHSASITERLSEVEPRILTLQRQLQMQLADQDRLVRSRDTTREAVLTLAQKVQESRIAAEDNGGEVVIASRATVPGNPRGSSKLVVTAVAGLLGGSLAVIGVFAIEWWREDA